MSRGHGHGRQRRRSYARRQRELRQRGPRPAIEGAEWQLPEAPPGAPRPPQSSTDNERGLAHG